MVIIDPHLQHQFRDGLTKHIPKGSIKGVRVKTG